MLILDSGLLFWVTPYIRHTSKPWQKMFQLSAE